MYKYDGAGRAVGYVQYGTNDMAIDVGINWTYDEKSQLTNSIIGFDYIYDTRYYAPDAPRTAADLSGALYYSQYA